MSPWFQYCDPLIEVFDYTVEVRLPSPWVKPFRFNRTQRAQKKGLEDDIDTDEEIAIRPAHNGDLRLIKDVRPSQNAELIQPSTSNTRA